MYENLSSKAELWAYWISSFQESGLSCKEWCQQNEIPLATFGYWNRKLQTESSMIGSSSEPVFARLPSEQELCSEECTGKAPVTICLSEDIRIEIGPDCLDRLVTALLQALKDHAWFFWKHYPLPGMRMHRPKKELHRFSCHH